MKIILIKKIFLGFLLGDYYRLKLIPLVYIKGKSDRRLNKEIVKEHEQNILSCKYPIILTRFINKFEYERLDGFHKSNAYKNLGFKFIPAIIGYKGEDKNDNYVELNTKELFLKDIQEKNNKNCMEDLDRDTDPMLSIAKEMMESADDRMVNAIWWRTTVKGMDFIEAIKDTLSKNRKGIDPERQNNIIEKALAEIKKYYEAQLNDGDIVFHVSSKGGAHYKKAIYRIDASKGQRNYLDIKYDGGGSNPDFGNLNLYKNLKYDREEYPIVLVDKFNFFLKGNKTESDAEKFLEDKKNNKQYSDFNVLLKEFSDNSSEDKKYYDELIDVNKDMAKLFNSGVVSAIRFFKEKGVEELNKKFLSSKSFNSLRGKIGEYVSAIKDTMKEYLIKAESATRQLMGEPLYTELYSKHVGELTIENIKINDMSKEQIEKQLEIIEKTINNPNLSEAMRKEVEAKREALKKELESLKSPKSVSGVINEPVEVNEHGTLFYDIDNLVSEETDVVIKEKHISIPLIQGEPIESDIFEMQSKKTKPYKSSSDLVLDFPIASGEFGKKLIGAKWYVKLTSTDDSKDVASKEEAISLLKTMIAIVERNEGKSVRFIEKTQTAKEPKDMTFDEFVANQLEFQNGKSNPKAIDAWYVIIHKDKAKSGSAETSRSRKLEHGESPNWEGLNEYSKEFIKGVYESITKPQSVTMIREAQKDENYTEQKYHIGDKVKFLDAFHGMKEGEIRSTRYYSKPSDNGGYTGWTYEVPESGMPIISEKALFPFEKEWVLTKYAEGMHKGKYPVTIWYIADSDKYYIEGGKTIIDEKHIIGKDDNFIIHNLEPITFEEAYKYKLNKWVEEMKSKADSNGFNFSDVSYNGFVSMKKDFEANGHRYSIGIDVYTPEKIEDENKKNKIKLYSEVIRDSGKNNTWSEEKKDSFNYVENAFEIAKAWIEETHKKAHYQKRAEEDQAIVDQKKIVDELYEKFKADENKVNSVALSDELTRYFQLICEHHDYSNPEVPKYDDFKYVLEINSHLKTKPYNFKLALYEKTDFIRPNARIWEKIPAYVIAKHQKAITVELNHENDNLQSVLKKFVSKNDGIQYLRLEGAYFDSNGVVATDSYKMIFIKGAVTQKGLWCVEPNCFKNEEQVMKDYKEHKFPQYKDIVPETTLVRKIDVLSLKTFVETSLKYGFYGMTNQGHFIITMKYNNDMGISLSADNLLDCIEGLEKLGYRDLEIAVRQNSDTPIIIAPVGYGMLAHELKTTFCLLTQAQVRLISGQFLYDLDDNKLKVMEYDSFEGVDLNPDKIALRKQIEELKQVKQEIIQEKEAEKSEKIAEENLKKQQEIDEENDRQAKIAAEILEEQRKQQEEIDLEAEKQRLLNEQAKIKFAQEQEEQKAIEKENADTVIQQEHYNEELKPFDEVNVIEKIIVGYKLKMKIQKTKAEKAVTEKIIRGYELKLKVAKRKADEHFAKGGSLCPVGTKIQTLIFDKELFTKEQAIAWAKSHGKEYGEVDEKENTYRLPQIAPSAVEKEKTITIREGVKAVIGCPVKKHEEGGNTSDDLLEFDIPNWALSALINADLSGLSDEDIEKLNKFEAKTIEQYGNANFMLPSDEELDLGFKWRNDIDGALGADCSRLYLRASNGFAKGGAITKSVAEWRAWLLTTTMSFKRNYDSLIEDRAKFDAFANAEVERLGGIPEDKKDFVVKSLQLFLLEKPSQFDKVMSDHFAEGGVGIGDTHEERFNRAIYLYYVELNSPKDSEFKNVSKEDFFKKIESNAGKIKTHNFDKSNIYRLSDSKDKWFSKSGNVLGEVWHEDELSSYWINSDKIELGEGGKFDSFIKNAKEKGKATYNKAKGAVEKKIHDKKKAVAIEVLNDTNKNVFGDRKSTIKQAIATVRSEYAQGGSLSDVEDTWFDILADMPLEEKETESLQEMNRVSKKLASKENFKLFKKRAINLKNKELRKYLKKEIEIIESKESGFKTIYGGKASDTKKVTAVSHFFNVFHQAYNYNN